MPSERGGWRAVVEGEEGRIRMIIENTKETRKECLMGKKIEFKFLFIRLPEPAGAKKARVVVSTIARLSHSAGGRICGNSRNDRD